MADRTLLVTGASAGIGRATALSLARMRCGPGDPWPDPESTKDAAGELSAAGGGPVEVFAAGLSAQSEVRRVAGEVLQRLPRIEVLASNAGGYWNTRHATADGLERTFALNHPAPFPHTTLLPDRLKHSARRGWSPSPPTPRPSGSGRIPRHGPTASPSWPTSCSPTSWPAGSQPARSPPMRCIPA